MERNFTNLERLFSLLCSFPSARITLHDRLWWWLWYWWWW